MSLIINMPFKISTKSWKIPWRVRQENCICLIRSTSTVHGVTVLPNIAVDQGSIPWTHHLVEDCIPQHIKPPPPLVGTIGGRLDVVPFRIFCIWAFPAWHFWLFSLWTLGQALEFGLSVGPPYSFSLRLPFEGVQ